MELVPAGIELSFEVTFDRDDLFVGMTVYDDSGLTPIQVLAPTLMDWVYRNTYRGKFNPSAQKNYIIVKSVYTDETLAELDDNYSSGSESCIAENIGSFGQIAVGCSIIGIVENNNPIVGIVQC